MLDQNTDRMWYVIGALVVGAGIILLANKAMPEIFASVADTFEDKADEVIEVTDGIGPNVRGYDYSKNVIAGKPWKGAVLRPIEDGDAVELRDNGYDQMIDEYIPVHDATSITLSLSEKLTDEVGYAGRINAYDEHEVGISTLTRYIYARKPYTMTIPLPEGTTYIRVMLIKGDSGAYSIKLNP